MKLQIIMSHKRQFGSQTSDNNSLIKQLIQNDETD